MLFDVTPICNGGPIVFCQCCTLFRQQIQTSSVVPKVYQLVCELFVKRDEPIRLVASGIIHLVRDAWFVAIQTHTIVARRLEAKRCVLLCLYSWLFQQDTGNTLLYY